MEEMKEKWTVVCLLFLMASTLLSACGSERTAVGAVTPVIVETQKKSDNTAPPVKLEDPGQNRGVIIDTVVDVFRDPDVQSERVTQAIFNQPVEVLDAKDNWTKVKVMDGYEGWIKSKYLDANTSSIKAGDFKYKLVVTNKLNKVYALPDGRRTLKQVAMGTEFYSKNKQNGYYEIALPEGKSGWIGESGVMVLSREEPIPRTGALDFVTTLNKFSGVTYLWGGISTWGIDCSGLTYICSRVNGVDLPRDADQQYKRGKAVTPKTSEMQPGDLVFFSTKTDLKDISHVGVYLGNDQFINASKSKGAVTINRLSEDYFKKRLVGVRRIF